MYKHCSNEPTVFLLNLILRYAHPLYLPPGEDSLTSACQMLEEATMGLCWQLKLSGQKKPTLEIFITFVLMHIDNKKQGRILSDLRFSNFTSAFFHT